MSTYSDLGRINDEEIGKLQSRRNSAIEAIVDTVEILVNSHGFPLSAFTYQSPEEERNYKGSLDCDVEEAVHSRKNGNWGCSMFVKISGRNSGVTIVYLDPEITVGERETKLGFSDKTDYVIRKPSDERSDVLGRYAELIVKEIKAALKLVSGDNIHQPGEPGFRILPQGSA